MRTILFILFFPVYLLSQTDEINLAKYWKLRDDFRENFVKIGDGPGCSITTRSYRPLDCIDNIPENAKDGFNFGTIHYGDALIRHGTYLSLLATEYKLLKNAGLNVTGTLNELYFALKVINRIDQVAESTLGPLYGMKLKDTLNGFYIREDTPANFAKENWGKTDWEVKCMESPCFNTNNAAEKEELPNLWAYGMSYHNNPSNDQFAAIMLGYRTIFELVDEQYIQPKGEKIGFYVIQEIRAQIDRMMTFLENHNWFYIDVNGWPVNNGGGDMIFTVYPLLKIAKDITGHSYSPYFNRNLAAYKKQNLIQFAVTGKGVYNDNKSESEVALKKVTRFPGGYGYKKLKNGGVYGAGNNQDSSDFQNFMFGKGGRRYHSDITKGIWNKQLPRIFTDYLDNRKFNSTLLPIGFVKWKFLGDQLPSDDNNIFLMSCYALTANLWKMETIAKISEGTGNYEMELLQSVLYGDKAPREAAFYQNILNSKPFHNSFNMTLNVNNPKGEKLEISYPQVNGWGAQNRFHYAEGMYGGSKSQGIFNGMDYLLFHNLYLLAFPSNTGYEVKSSTFHDTILPFKVKPEWGLSDEVAKETELYMNLKLKKVETETKSVFGNAANFPVFGTKTIQPFFGYYADLEIFTTDFLCNTVTIQSEASLIVENNLQICNGGNLIVQPNGTLEIRKGTTRIEAGSTVFVKGELIVHPEAKLIVESGGILLFEKNSIVDQLKNTPIEKKLGATITIR
jgi:hypothetical protein